MARLSAGNFIPFSQTVSDIADSQAILYCIEKGDTLSQIAREYNVSLQSLMLTNNMNDRTILEVGTTLRIPISQGTVHIVASGDTISNLAERYQVSISALIEANPDIDPDSLNVGDYLRIPVDGMLNAQYEPSRGTMATLSWPLAGTITSNFGWRKNEYHKGLDIAADMGDPIYAAAAGKVSFVGFQSGYGRTVIIDHNNGIQTLYAHTQKVYVKKGETVSMGQVIALIGMTGRTTGPHVHFEVRVNNKARNPISFLKR
jgi:murein DD-endopeptidase MepM/ murein hydrolase activator NlpD